ncbi:MAG: 2-isopropylmalate synthase [Oscillospiraceae bacterium]|jgi:2-isopropylmalate synthase|nr:2-isopropylmalate synthase [Oscillospiraceae bacterium]
MATVKIFDTTLRDGEQAPGCSMNLEEKLEVAKQLETLGVDVMEAGFAVSSPGDFESVKSIAGIIKNSTVASLSRSVNKDIDASYEALKNAVSPRIHLFLATSPIHMQYKLKMSPEQVLERAVEMTKYAKSLCGNVEFSAEDATRSDREFLKRVVYGVIDAGANVVNIPDTVGFTTPTEMYDLVAYLKENVPNIDKADISLHCHNDLGMAVANSLEGVRAGATQVECTVNGLGERAGNAALEEIIMALGTREPFFGCETRINTQQIYRTSRLVYSIIGQTAPMNKAVVGANAFLHESGIHQHGVLAEKTTYEIFTPESIGINQNRLVLGKHSGRHAFETRVSELGYALTREEIDSYFVKFKEICDKKKTVTDADLEAILSQKEYNQSLYRLLTFDVHSGKNASAVCVIRLERDGGQFEEVALGDGPVDAAYKAIDKITNAPESVLEMYTIHSTSDGKDALGEVTIKLRAGERLVTGRGLSTDIIESSILAYLNAANKLLS